ncbi:NUDIX hydrolase [Lentibacillus sp. L22]|uniref:NUDIX hydrolase n=1 Tax=Lentibacillus TaxID=175304 RepID=UPI0022B1CBCF|nr:NUDIX hydrolase [Lentibacillus daqui]
MEWVKQIQAIAQTGLAYTRDVYDQERYEQLRELSIEIMSNYTKVDKETIRLDFANDTGYATPKVDIRGVVFNEQNEILLVKEKSDAQWSLPGGWGDIGYSPSEVAVKEIKEESGYAVKASRLLAVLDKSKHNHPPDPHYVYKIFIECKIVSGKSEAGVETSDVGFFDISNLPALSIKRNTKEQIELMFEFNNDPNKNIVFD